MKGVQSIKLDYKQARKYVDSLSVRGIKPGLENINKLCRCLGNPQDNVKIIHIAGTNGKGSTGAFISSILSNAGYKVGRYVSPAVSEYREIIRINDEYISEEDYAAVISRISQTPKEICPTAFEAETAAAFLYFDIKKCDYAIIECGMGGLLDATNIIKNPCAVVITSISRDHTAYLGDTITEIAKNKAGIIKHKSKVFSALQPHEAMAVINKTCIEKQAELTVSNQPEIVSFAITGTTFNYREYKNIYIPLAGAYQPYNVCTAIDVCRGLGIGSNVIVNGLKNTKWHFRFDADSDGWIYDGAHNPDAALQLRKTIDTLLSDKKLAFIVGVFRDKEYDDIMRITVPAADTVYTVKPPSARGLESSILADTVRRYCTNVIDAVSVENAVRLCAKADFDNVVVFGSLSFLSYIKYVKEAFYEQMSKDN